VADAGLYYPPWRAGEEGGEKPVGEFSNELPHVSAAAAGVAFAYSVGFAAVTCRARRAAGEPLDSPDTAGVADYLNSGMIFAAAWLSWHGGGEGDAAGGGERSMACGGGFFFVWTASGLRMYGGPGYVPSPKRVLYVPAWTGEEA